MTRAGFGYILAKHVATASRAAPTIAGKGVSRHVLRHTCAMHTLQATRDVRKVSLRSPDRKARSARRHGAADAEPGRFRAPDKLLAMLSTVKRRPDYAE